MANMPNNALLNGEILGDFDADVQNLQTLLNYPLNKDAVFHSFSACGIQMCVVLIDGMADSDRVSDFVLRAAQKLCPASPPSEPQARLKFLQEHVLEIPQLEEETQYKKLLASVLSGMTLLLAEGLQQAILLETRGFEKRSVSHTTNESVVIGSQEGFVESMRTNITLLRRYCQSPQLITEFTEVGTKVPSRVGILYLKGVANETVLREIRRRIKCLDAPCVQGIGQLQQYIEDSWMALLPQMLETERPDRAVSCLLDGQVVLVMDNSPYALIAPITLYHLLHASDDSYMRWQYGSFLRIIRIFGILLSLFLPGLYVALTLYHTHLISMSLLSSIAEARSSVPIPVLLETMIMELAFYLINEAGTRMPSQIGSALGIVGGLILGQAAVAASIISPIMIIIVAITGLGNYVIPNYGFSVGTVVYRLLIIFAGAIAGLYGILLVTFALFCHLCSMRSFGVPYMAPVAPWRPHNPDILLRLPLWMQKTRMFFAPRNNWIDGEEEDE
ncbi:MAG: spore germination protein [Eubacteriales bacterium]|nr:spore germination protein [Eubacteriales bacterium]